jgi:hypothetical protein
MPDGFDLRAAGQRAPISGPLLIQNYWVPQIYVEAELLWPNGRLLWRLLILAPFIDHIFNHFLYK